MKPDFADLAPRFGFAYPHGIAVLEGDLLRMTNSKGK